MDNIIGGLVPELLLILVLTLVNAFFSASEMSIISLNKSRITYLAEEGNEKASIILKLLEEPSRFLAIIQVGITLAGFFASASAATTVSNRFSIFLQGFNVPYSDKISVVVVTVLLAYFTLVFGELYPKRVALQKSEEIAMFAAKPILVVSKIIMPFVKLLSGSTNSLIKLSGMSLEDLEEKVSKEEIRSLIEVGQEKGVINETEKDMINGIFEFDDTIAREVMTARTDVFAIDGSKHNDIILDEILKEKYSRIPVYEEDTDNIIGILYIKDLFSKIAKSSIDKIDIKQLLRPPYFVPETKNIDVLFKELQETKNHMAILIDEYGGFSGIVTIEDLIEEVMGNIFDEYDEYEQNIKKIDKDTYVVNGLLPIDEVNELLDLDLQSENSDTIGGFVIDLLGSIPIENEENTIEYENIIFKIEKVSEKRIEKLKIYVNQEK
ncbi:hemolysin family protein [Clostridium sp. DJ247]|uniref:hemolysin family protein n=1 Tax=Clostridium sp. DJ247 TaxID=2726188 RepID=UPI00162733D3|nr:hemolysin family protein [Clostridium sp. DJ247]MBC2581053.1 HlyC/CorC family transporter [Clostridium sp. DJ247]